MLSLNFIARVKNYAINSGLNPADYSYERLTLRMYNALRLRKTHAEFMTEIFREVKKRRFEDDPRRILR